MADQADAQHRGDGAGAAAPAVFAGPDAPAAAKKKTQKKRSRPEAPPPPLPTPQAAGGADGGALNIHAASAGVGASAINGAKRARTEVNDGSDDRVPGGLTEGSGAIVHFNLCHFCFLLAAFTRSGLHSDEFHLSFPLD